MSSAYLIVTRFTELLLTGQVEKASTYLDEGVILQSWQGVVEGKADVISYLSDSRRFMHHKRSFGPWRLVHRTMESEALQGPRSSLPATSGKPGPAVVVEDDEEFSDYDGQGYAVFERLGKMSTRPRFSVKSEKVRETVALRNDLIVLIVLSKRGI